MAKKGQTVAQANKEIRREALRDQLTAQGHVQHVIEICEELNDLERVLDSSQVTRKKIVIDTKLRLINKYLPDLKATELTGKDGAPIEIDNFLQIEIIGED